MNRYLACALAIILAPFVYAATASTSVRIAGVPGGAVQLTIEGTSVAVDGVGAGQGKGSAVVSCVVSGQAVVMLVRVQRAHNGTFVDLVPSNTLGNLETAVGAMDLSATVADHPSPADDAIDAEAIADAGG